MLDTATQDALWFLDTLINVRVSCEDSADGVSVIESVAPWGHSPPLHVHTTEDEIFRILDGEFRFVVGDEEIVASAGDTLCAPQGVPHTFRVESERGHWLVVTAHGDFERFVRAMSRPAERDDLPAVDGPPTPEQQEMLARVAEAHNCTILGPPLD